MSQKIQVFPHGLMLGPMPYKPVMIFKSKDEKEILPVAMDPVNAGIVMADTDNLGRFEGAHRATLKIFKELGVEVQSVYLNELQGHDIMALAGVVQGENKMNMKFKAPDILPLALKAGAEFFVNEDVVEKAKLLNLEWAMEQASQHEQGDRTLVGGRSDLVH